MLEMMWHGARNTAYELGRTAFLIPRRLTAASRSLPDFLILGAPKAGTTSLFEIVCRHPQVMRSLYKEVHFFDRNFELGLDWYRAHFPLERRKRRASAITGEASPSYLGRRHMAERVKSVIPGARFIAVLRNPIDRAYSSYHHFVRYGQEHRSFEESIPQSSSQFRAEEAPVSPHRADTRSPDRSYLRGGLYHQQLQRWFSLFPQEQFLILEFEEAFRDLRPTMERICSHLSISRWETAAQERRNVGHYQPMDPAVREKLRQFYEPHNENLYALLGRSFDWS